jgi:hypothetical protein
MLRRPARPPAQLTAPAPRRAPAAEAELRHDTDWMEVTDRLQRRVVREFGAAPAAEDAALRHLRAAPHRHPHLKPLALYHRFQRSRQGDLGEGGAVPRGLELLDLATGGAVELAALAAGPRPLAVAAGSWS